MVRTNVSVKVATAKWLTTKTMLKHKLEYIVVRSALKVKGASTLVVSALLTGSLNLIERLHYVPIFQSLFSRY